MSEGESQDPAAPRTAGASERLRASKERVLALWEQRLRAEVPAAAQERHPILINTLPVLLDSLAGALSPEQSRSSGAEGTTVAEEHGGERGRLTRFRLQDVITEYTLLREVLVAVLEEDAPLTREERRVIDRTIDESVTSASIAYVLVQEGFREQLFAILAHDLRGPLGVASTALTLIQSDPSSPEVPRWAGRAVDGVARVGRIVEDLLDSMRVQAGGGMQLALAECDVMEVVRAAVEHLRAEHGDRFVLQGPESVPGHLAPDALRRAIENLGSNAVKYGEASQPVTIGVDTVHERIMIRVHNEGSYIPVEEQETIFRAFHRLRSAEESGKTGWGLGLAQVRGVAEAHGGSIGIDSAPERGTTFTIDVPADARPFQGAPTTP